MKEIKLISFISIIFIISICKFSYATDRLVDIPVPENSKGYADSTLEEKNKQLKEYEEKIKKAEIKEKKMKKYRYIIIPVIALIVAIIVINITIKKEKKITQEENNDSKTTDETNEINTYLENSVENINNVNEEEVENIKKEINSTADTNIYYVTQEKDGRKILQIKPKVQFQVDMAGIIKNSKPEEDELEQLNKKSPTKTGMWVSEQSREKFLKLLNKNNIDEFSIKKDGYVNIDKKAKSDIAKKIEEMINSDKLYIINITGIAYERDYISGEIVEYPFEDMDPEQIIEPYVDDNKIILEITTNKNGKLSDEEIVKEITLY